MQRISGLFLILAGASLAAYTFIPAPFDGEQALREVTRISAAPDRSFDEAQGPAAPLKGRGSLFAGQNLAAAAVKAGERLETGSLNKPSTTWSAVVTAAPTTRGRITSSKPADSTTRAQLTRDLQAELKRVGCYGGEISGAWTNTTKRAMRAFMERVNATLPLEDPDYILLTLVQGHRRQACGAGCPSGQTVSESGRCLPKAVVAARTAKDRNLELVANQTPAESRGALSVRPSSLRPSSVRPTGANLDVPKPVAATRPVGAKVAVARIEPERLPWLEGSASTPRRVARPDGMMSVGGPSQDAKAAVEPGAESITPARKRMRFAAIEDDDLEWQNDRTSSDKFERPMRAARPKVDTSYDVAPAAISAPNKPRPAKSAKRSKSDSSAKKGRSGKSNYASNRRRTLARPGSPAYNMLQAMGGVF